MHSKLNKFIFGFFCSFFLLSFSGSSFSNPQDTQQAITIEADRAVLDEKNETSTYTGNVILKQGGIEVKANTITAFTNNGQLKNVIAEGQPVEYHQDRDTLESIRGTSLRMEYNTESKQLLLLKSAELWQGDNHFSGERILYDAKNEKVIASGNSKNSEQGSQRVKIIFKPRSKSTPKKQDKP